MLTLNLFNTLFIVEGKLVENTELCWSYFLYIGSTPDFIVPNNNY